MRRSVIGTAAFAAGALGGAVLGFLAERRVVHPIDGGDRVIPRRPDAHYRELKVESYDGTKLQVEISGPPDGPTILFVHGLSLTRLSWHNQRADLEDTFRVVAFDQRGHGDSDDAVSGEYSAVALGRDVGAVLGALGPDPVLIVGHSMGGMAILAAVEESAGLVLDRLAGVVLLNGAASGVIWGLRGGWIAAGIASVREHARDNLFSRMLYGGLREDGEPRGNDLTAVITRQLGVGPDAPAEAVELVRNQVLASRPYVAAALWRTIGTLDLMAAAGRVHVPALIIAGGRDRLLPAGHSRRLAEVMPDATLVELHGVGHVAMLERPGHVSARLRAFAARVFPES